ncbi:Peptidase S54, rhomboid domain [Dillenia turbinata]|uniref:Peptidase S54, rhomboid domain n=1 Tax=Dillenia turbinata TaxID=194707 RepID=A0AAN8Z1F9_9MAGN
MQRLLAFRINSTISKALPNPQFLNTQLSKSFISLSKPTQNTFTSHLPRTTTHLWRLNNVVSKTSFSGVFSNPWKTLLRSELNGVFGCRVLKFLRNLLQRGNFQFNRVHYYNQRGWRSWLPRPTTEGMVLGLLVANTAVYLLWRVADTTFMLRNFTISVNNITSGRLHTMITSAFSHIDIGHLISNMIGLYFFGMSIGREFGPEFLLKLYLAGAVAGSIFYFLHHTYLARSSQGQGMWTADISNKPGMGASGAVNAILLLDIFLFPTATLYFQFFIPVPAMLLGVFLIGKDVLRIIQGDSHVSGSAHLGGAVVAALAWARLRKRLF